MPYKPGESGNPAGRPAGSRNKITKAYLDAFAKDFEENGMDVIEKVRTEKPEVYMTLAARLIPQKLEHTGEDGEPIQLGTTERAARIAAIINAARDRGDRQTVDGGDAGMDAADRPTD